MMTTVNTREHYEWLVDEGFDAFEYSESLLAYQARWDGPTFYDLLGDLGEKSVLEIGVGTGRLAREVIARGCRAFTGIDFSPKTVALAKEHFLREENAEIILADAESFVRPEAFDVAYSVLTFLHIEDKQKTLANIVKSLRPGGHLVLSINLVRYTCAEGEEDWLDYGTRKVRLFSAPPASYVRWLEQLGCQVDEPVELVDTFVHPNGKRSQTYGESVASLVRAVKQ